MTNVPPPFNSRFHNLPTQLTSLIGREQEIEAVCALLHQEQARLVTLTGTGGIGKTRLAFAVAAQLLDSFSDGVYFVPLAPVSNPRLVIPTIAHLLGMVHQQSEQHQSTEHMDYLKALLGAKRFLLVLDNFEQVVAAASELPDLLAVCPHLKILVTSRAALHIQGEYEFAVPPLALPRHTHIPAVEALAQYAAVALFLQRALAIKPDLSLTRANMQAIATICVHLDGLPLAIELAAARIKLLPPQALLQRLTYRRLEVLTGGARNAPLRQQTLRDTLAWSYNLLDNTEQRLFRQLSVFVGGCTLEAIEIVAGATTQVLDKVASLIDKSLLLQIEHEGDEPRLLMLETIREYGLEMLAANKEMEATRQAHAAYYLALAEQAEPHYGGPQQAAWLDRLEREHDNLRAAMRWSIEQTDVEENEQRAATALRLGGALRRFWLVHAHVNEGREFLEQALAIRKAVAPTIRAKALIAAANLAIAQNDYQHTEAFCRESLALFRSIGDQPNIAFSLHLLGAALWNTGNLSAGSALIEEALALFRTLHNKDLTAWSLSLLALFDIDQGKYARAIALLEESLALHRDVEHKRGIAFSLARLALVLFISQGDQATIPELLAESLALSQPLGDKDNLAYVSSLQGQIAFQQGDLTTARAKLDESLLLSKEVGSRHSTAKTLTHLAQVVAAQGNLATAYTLYEESLALSRELNNPWLIAPNLEGLAAVIAAQHRLEQAAQFWGAAEAMREANGAPLHPIERPGYERAIAAARMRLGEKSFAAAWAQGRTMTLEQIFAAQGETPTASPSVMPAPAPSPAYPAGLTEREVQVLRLVARGLTNTEAAAKLSLSEKTIAHHLTHIFNKTGSDNRAGAVAFAIRHGLA